MKDRRRRGFRAERELVKKLWKYGFAAIRGPASGAKVKKSVYPDVVAIYKGKVLVFEVKSRKKLQSIYMKREQLDKILEFARRAGGEAFIAIRLSDLRDWRIVPTSSLSIEGDRVKVPKDVIERAPSFETFISTILNKPLDSFTKASIRRSNQA